eukprot:gene17904-36583_t
MQERLPSRSPHLHCPQTPVTRVIRLRDVGLGDVSPGACHPWRVSVASWVMMVVVDVDELFVRCRADLVRFATALVGPDDAWDVVSEVVVSTLSGGRLDQVDDVRAYWFRAVANRSMSWHRSAERQRRRDTRHAIDRTGDRDEMSAVEGREVLDVLTGQQRVVIYLTY